MNSFKLAIHAASVSAVLLALAACEGTQPTAAPGKVPAANKDVLFSETFSDSGLFTISKNPLGGYDYSIEARIGSTAERMIGTTVEQSSLAEIYRTLHEGKGEVPAVVGEASAWLESRPAPVSDKPAFNPAQVALEKGASESAFKTGYCRSFGDGIYTWKSMSCIWKASANQAVTPGVLGDNFANDRVYAWNNSGYTATMSLYKSDWSGKANTWMPTLKPYWVTWFSWGGTYTNANAVIQLPYQTYGEVGLSNHSRYLK